MPFLAPAWAGIAAFVRRWPRWGGFGALAVTSLLVEGVAAVCVLVFALVFVVLGAARRWAAVDALSGYRHTARPALAEENDEEFRRQATAMRRSATATIATAGIALAAALWMLTRGLGAAPFLLAFAAGAAAIAADVDALTHQPAVTQRLVNALLVRVHANVLLRRTRGDLTRTDGVLQPPLVATVAAICALVSLLSAAPALAGFEQIPPGRIVRWVSDRAHDKLPRAGAATPSPGPAPSPVPDGPPPPPVTTSPTPSVEDVCGPDVRERFGLRSETKALVGDATVWMAMYDAYLRVGATEAGCPAHAPEPVNGLWVVRLARHGTASGIVLARSTGDAVVVLAPLDALVAPLLTGTPGVERVEPRERSGTGDYQSVRLRDATCRVALRRQFSDPYTLLEPAVTRVVVDVALARGQFPFVASRRRVGAAVEYSIGFEASGGQSLTLAYSEVDGSVRGVSPRVEAAAACPDLDAFAQLAHEDQRRHTAVLATVR